MKNPKISVIVPVYKAEDYLYRCVESLFAQTLQDFEILLIDDGSPDRSGELCDEYAKKNSRVRVFHKENGGVSSARQCGLDNAQGEYVIHADPDDWVEPNMLEELYKKAKEDDADMVICDFYTNYGEIQQYVKQEPEGLDHKVVLRNFFQQLHGSCWNKLVRRSCYNDYNISFDLELSFCEDLYLNASLLKNPIKVTYYPGAFYHYDQSINQNSIVQTFSRKQVLYDIKLYNKFSALFLNMNIWVYAHNHLGWMIVSRAYDAHILTSKEFRILCKPYRKTVFSKKINLITACLMYISCLGYYEVVYKIHNIIKSIRHKLL